MKRTTALATAAGAIFLASTFACVANETRTPGYNSDLFPAQVLPAAKCLVQALNDTPGFSGAMTGETTTYNFEENVALRHLFTVQKGDADKHAKMALEWDGDTQSVKVFSDFYLGKNNADGSFHSHESLSLENSQTQLVEVNHENYVYTPDSGAAETATLNSNEAKNLKKAQDIAETNLAMCLSIK